jgi:hypothetical protein
MLNWCIVFPRKYAVITPDRINNKRFVVKSANGIIESPPGLVATLIHLKIRGKYDIILLISE